jgi:subtilase family serine protease
VRNSGKGEAPPFDVTLDGKTPTTVSGLKVGDTQTVRFVAPRCVPGQVLLFAADGDGLVEETDESDNALRVECPSVVARTR